MSAEVMNRAHGTVAKSETLQATRETMAPRSSEGVVRFLFFFFFFYANVAVSCCAPAVNESPWRLQREFQPRESHQLTSPPQLSTHLW